MQSKKYWSFWDGVWYTVRKSHLVFLKLNSINNPLMSPGKLCFLKNLEGMSFLAIINIPPLFQFLSSPRSFEDVSIIKLDGGEVSSAFVSLRTRILMLFVMRGFSWSNLSDKEFIFTWPTTILFALLNLNLSSSHSISPFCSFSDWNSLFLDKFSLVPLNLNFDFEVCNNYYKLSQFIKSIQTV